MQVRRAWSRHEVGVGRLSDTNTAKGRPLQVNTYSESVYVAVAVASCEGLVVMLLPVMLLTFIVGSG